MNYTCYLFDTYYPFPDSIEKRTLFDLDNVTLKTCSVKDIFEDDADSFWRDWVGSQKAEQLDIGMKNVLYTYYPEKESKKYQSIIARHLYFLKFVGRIHPSESGNIGFSGRVLDKESQYQKIKNINNLIELRTWSRPYYIGSEAHIEHDSMFPPTGDYESLELWEKLTSRYLYLEETQLDLKCLNEALDSYSEALNSRHLKFKIPNLVRSIESILALPKGKGSKSFKNDILKLCEIDYSLPFFSEKTLEKDLLDLYQMRSDCSHGKPYTWSLDRDFSDYNDDDINSEIKIDIAQFEYIAEEVSRSLIQKAIFHENVKVWSDREYLESYMRNIKAL